MSQDQALQYLQQGIAAAKAKNNAEARRLLQNAIRLDPNNETAWLWLSSVAKDNKERLFCLQQLLRINPNNEMAQKGLKALGATAEPAAQAQPKSSIPQPAPDRLAAARDQASDLLDRLTQPDDPLADLTWLHKTRNRAGERAATMLTLSVRVVPILVVLCLLAAGAFVVTNYPDAIALAPTWTPSFTPTQTATPTPGFTPTPSPTPQITYTPSPTLDPAIPQGDLFAEMTPTPIYPRINSSPLLAAVVQMDHGEYAAALPTISSERELTSTNFDPAPYYYEAIALVNLGDVTRAERIMEEAQSRLEEMRELDRQEAEPLIHAGLAVVYAAQGDYTASNEEADLAIQGDPRLSAAYYLMAQNALAQNELQRAADVIEAGLRSTPGDVNLWILHGELNLRRSQPAAAQQDAYTALTIDPTAEDAYLLQARADMARGDYGLAVLHLQSYLFTYPGSIEGWTLLGDARASEGNTDLAIAAYAQAVNTDDPLPAQIRAYQRRAELYLQRNQFDQAYRDYDRVLDIDSEQAGAREGRARAAFRSGRYGEALEDLDILLEEQPDRNDLALLKAEAILESADDRDEEAYAEALTSALDILSGNFPNGLPADLAATAYEYRARVLFAQEAYNDALNDIQDSLERLESGSAHYWRGRIEEALGNTEAAVQEYAWVRLWGSVYSYPFLPDTLTRLEALAPPEEAAS
jgi:tetratricopeptide (TPR) repeat protein